MVLGVAMIAIGIQESCQPLVTLTAGRFKRLPGIVAEPRGKHHEMTSPGTRQLQWQTVAGSVIFIFEGVLLATGMLDHGIASRVLVILALVCLAWLLAAYIAEWLESRKQSGSGGLS